MSKLDLDRRQVLKLLGAGALVPLVGCGDDGESSGACNPIPAETAGPFPGDGSNGPNALAMAGVVRGDIRSSFGTLSGTAAGIPLTLTLTLVDTSAVCAPLAGYAVYLWHCDRVGLYSLYSTGAQDQNYLRGVQATDGAGVVTFTTIYPGCYTGRWPHIHFEIFPSLAAAMSGGNELRTSQLALPAATSLAVYGTSEYSLSASNFSRTALATDSVFRDGSTSQIPTVSGNTTAGYSGVLTTPTLITRTGASRTSR